jgi:amino acid permease
MHLPGAFVLPRLASSKLDERSSLGSCTNNPQTSVDYCDLGERHPSLWGRVIINFLYAVAALALMVALVRSLSGYRRARIRRYDSDVATERYRNARNRLTLVAVLLAVLTVPIIAALSWLSVRT